MTPATPSGISAVPLHTALPGEDGSPPPAVMERSSRAHAAWVYHPVRQLPYELRDHIRVFLEEQMYGDAIQLLASLLAAGGSDQPAHSTSAATAAASPVSPVWVPPPSHLAVLATLVVHPAHTSRPQKGDTDLRVAGHALQYLQHILAVAGPVQADLARAFTFKGQRQGREWVPGARGTSGRASRGGAGSRMQAGSQRPTPIRATASRRNPRRQQPNNDSYSASDYVDSSTLSLGDDDNSRGGKPKNGHLTADAVRHHHHSRTNDDDGYGGGGHSDGNGALTDDDDDFDGEDEDEDENDLDAVVSRMATRDSLWTRGQDFWHVVGWALGCSVAEPARWRFWRPWLAYMLDVLEADLGARVREAAAAAAKTKGEEDRSGVAPPLYKTLLFQYVDGYRSHTQVRRITAAILASDGQQQTGSGSIFDRETTNGGVMMKKPRDGTAAAPATKGAARDLGNFPLDDGYDDGDANANAAAVGAFDGHDSDSVGPGDRPGYLESLPLRRRLVYLLVLASFYFPDDFVSTSAVYRAVAEVLREADVSIYASFLASLGPDAVADPPPLFLQPLPLPMSRSLSPPSPLEAFFGLLRHILVAYMPATAPRGVDMGVDGSSSSSPLVLERCFLPFAANTVLLGANLRMALAIEAQFRLVWSFSSPSSSCSPLDPPRPPIWSPSLQEAAEAGVRAREARVRTASTKGKPGRKPAVPPPVATTTTTKTMTAIEALGQDLLKRSGRRLLAMVQLAKLEAGAGV